MKLHIISVCVISDGNGFKRFLYKVIVYIVGQNVVV